MVNCQVFRTLKFDSVEDAEAAVVEEAEHAGYLLAGLCDDAALAFHADGYVLQIVDLPQGGEVMCTGQLDNWQSPDPYMVSNLTPLTPLAAALLSGEYA